MFIAWVSSLCHVETWWNLVNLSVSCPVFKVTLATNGSAASLLDSTSGDERSTALHLSAQQGHVEACRWLLAARAEAQAITRKMRGAGCWGGFGDGLAGQLAIQMCRCSDEKVVNSRLKAGWISLDDISYFHDISVWGSLWCFLPWAKVVDMGWWDGYWGYCLFVWFGWGGRGAQILYHITVYHIIVFISMGHSWACITECNICIGDHDGGWHFLKSVNGPDFLRYRPEFLLFVPLVDTVLFWESP